MGKLSVLRQEQSSYSCLLLHATKPLLFAGTFDGLVEVWDLEEMKLKAKLRYLLIDEFGETYPIEDKVVNLSAPLEFDLVYAFMGNAAYCIDVDILTIVEKVPISEEVVNGNIGPQSGDIGVITKPGYLSRWSPKFVERIASIDLPFSINQCYLMYDFDEKRMILVFPEGKLLVSNLTDNPYTVELQMERAKELTNGLWYDRNQEYQAVITKEGTIDIYDGEDDIPEISSDHLLYHGKAEAEMKVREYVLNQDTSETVRQYITDFRLHRQSRDRYVAEVEKLQENSKYSGTLQEDSKTLHFALKETTSNDIDAKTTAYSVIDKIANRHDIDPKYVFFANKLDISPTELIGNARYYESEAYRRQTQIKKYLGVSLFLVLFLIILSELLVFNIFTMMIPGLLIFTILVLLYLVNITNVNPTIPGIQDYKAIRWLILISLGVSIILIISNSFGELIPRPI